MAKSNWHKPADAKRSVRQEAESWDNRAEALRMGVPEFLVRMVGRERLKALPEAEPVHHHCD